MPSHPASLDLVAGTFFPSNPPEHLKNNANAFDDEPAADIADEAADEAMDEEAPADADPDGDFGADPGMDDEPPADDASGEDPFNARDS
ncbi:MAG: hypothetical protein NT171_11365 [Planctomycetota bacterium]|nr:hypothetical protein [Planctomycetota bacterium]